MCRTLGEYIQSKEPIPFSVYNYKDYVSKQVRGLLPQ